MEKLFGVPIDQLLVVLSVVFAVVVGIVVVAALRNRVTFNLGVRNVPRRKAQTVLIVVGLMLATLLFSASFATGDTLTHSIRLMALDQLGQVDVAVRGDTPDASGRLTYFDRSVFDSVETTLATVPEVEGVAPQIQEKAPVLASATSLSVPDADVLGMDSTRMQGFDSLVDDTGNVLALDALQPGQAYVSTALAEQIDASVGDSALVYLSAQPVPLQIAGIYQTGAFPAAEESLVLPLDYLQALTGNEGQINNIVVSNRGDAVQGAQYTETVESALAPVLAGTGLETVPLKQDALTDADEAGSSFSTIFLLFGQFSIAAGIMLIFLIFVMLAAERKREMGIARAVGMQREHLVRMFAFEGVIYAAIAAAVGSVLGVAVGWSMVRIMVLAVGDIEDLELTYLLRWQSVFLAFAMGIVFTFGMVALSSWRVSRLNIVRAIRDIPEPVSKRSGIRGLVIATLVPVLGALLVMAGLQSEQGGTFFLGASLVIIGVPIVAMRFGLPERAAYTIAGAGLVVWWLIPDDQFERLFPFLPDFQVGIEMFFLSGILIVLGGVWVVMYNSDLLLGATVFALGWLRGMPPVLKTAVAYPMQSRFRTGITLAMFSLVVFTLVVMAFVLQGVASVYENTERISGGYEVSASTSPLNPIGDLGQALDGVDGISANDVTAIGSISALPVDVDQVGTGQAPVDFLAQGVDRGYSDTVGYSFAMRAEGYQTDQQVWQALQEQPDTVVVASSLVPARSSFDVGEQLPDFQMEGFYVEDEVLPEVFVHIQDQRTGAEKSLRVIGVLEELAFYGGMLVTSSSTLADLAGQPVPPIFYMLRLQDGVDASAFAQAVEAAFLENGVQTTVLEDEINDIASTNLMVNNLLQGFMGLGLVVGIAALGVIAARSVVERKQQIGTIRALGFQRGMVQASFLLESSFVALLGIVIGLGLGMALSINLVNAIAEQLPGVNSKVPWLNILIIAGIAFGAAMLTTFLPARQASRVYPAEALRAE